MECLAHRNKVWDDFERFQDEVRDSILKNGCYMVDEGYYARSEALQAIVKEEYAKIDLSRIEFGEWDYDGDLESVQ
uniref:Uncharacterized protein n=1 Tax=Leersia perrieri TaxID=77586 RepID=A0A0D9W883_9ORYZ